MFHISPAKRSGKTLAVALASQALTHERNHEMRKLSMSSSSAALVLALAAGLPSAFGQQGEISTRPGSGIVRTRGRDGYKRRPRSRTPEQVAKHEAKMKRRHLRWACGIACNPCLSMAQKAAIFR